MGVLWYKSQNNRTVADCLTSSLGAFNVASFSALQQFTSKTMFDVVTPSVCNNTSQREGLSCEKYCPDTRCFVHQFCGRCGSDIIIALQSKQTPNFVLQRNVCTLQMNRYFQCNVIFNLYYNHSNWCKFWCNQDFEISNSYRKARNRVLIVKGTKKLHLIKVRMK